jgi:NAD+ diphosphatase
MLVYMPMISNQLNYFCETHFLFRENSILLQEENLPDEQIMRKCLIHNIAADWFAESDHNYSAILLEPNAPNPSGCIDIPLRDFFYQTVDTDKAALAARARGLLNFRAKKRYCSICGGALHDDEQMTARTCVQCGNLFFPQLEPAVIVLITRGDELLLARNRNWKENIYGCIAGFVEMGETIEDCVKREVMEETSLEISHIQYAGSQSWPFPDQLMLAFTAQYRNGEIKIQETELQDAQWFNRNDLPPIPKPGSVAYNLIMNIFGEKTNS